MKHLYIIGNGFDLFTGFRTSYADFKRWLEINYVFVYENMKAAYNMEGEWWNNFEVNLGELDIHQYVRNFTPPEKSAEEIIKQIEERNNHLNSTRLIPDLHIESTCARRLRGLLDILQYCFERWVADCQSMITAPNTPILRRMIPTLSISIILILLNGFIRFQMKGYYIFMVGHLNMIN